jgi:serine/threonine-protein kinase
MSPCVYVLDGLPVRLKAPFDLRPLSRYGRVFKVFDGQDSGNLCFGMEANDGGRLFVKFAGAQTAEYEGAPADAVARLKASVPIYQNLAHPNLIRLIKAEDAGGGYAAVFGWVEGFCMGRMYPEDRSRFMALPLAAKLRVYDEILDFHAFAVSKGYVAVDFYDGSVLWDAKNERAVVCDIDFYAKSPYFNTMGRLWGSSRFMSPEELELGAQIDERSNVYALGAMGFALFSDFERGIEAWPLGAGSHAALRRATSDARGLRQPTVCALRREWRAARQALP